MPLERQLLAQDLLESRNLLEDDAGELPAGVVGFQALV